MEEEKSPAVSALAGFDPSRFEEFEAVLCGLASAVGAGGYNAETVDPDVFDRKIRWGIDNLVNMTIQRCADVIEEQSKSYARNSYGDCKRAVLNLKLPVGGDACLQDWRIGQMQAELEHRAVSIKGGELFCELCSELVGADGTLHPSTCPLSYGYEHIRAAIATDARSGETARLDPQGDSAAIAHPTPSQSENPHG